MRKMGGGGKERTKTKKQKEYTSEKMLLGVNNHKKASLLESIIRSFALSSQKVCHQNSDPSLSKWPSGQKSLVTFDVSVNPPYEQIGAQIPHSS